MGSAWREIARAVPSATHLWSRSPLSFGMRTPTAPRQQVAPGSIRFSAGVTDATRTPLSQSRRRNQVHVSTLTSATAERQLKPNSTHNIHIVRSGTESKTYVASFQTRDLIKLILLRINLVYCAHNRRFSSLTHLDSIDDVRLRSTKRCY